MTNQKSPTELLSEEHRGVLEKLDALEGVLNNLEQKEKSSVRLRELTSFFNTDFWVHFEKEEKALFPEFEEVIPRDSGPLGVMLAEHEELRKTNAEIQQVVTAYLNHTDNAETRQKISRNGAHFIGLLRDHIFKEDNILFRMIDMHIDQKQREKVLKLFTEIERAD